MEKKLLHNPEEFAACLKELVDGSDTELSFDEEEAPKSYPCLLISQFVDDVEFGTVYHVDFVYPDSFTVSEGAKQSSAPQNLNLF